MAKETLGFENFRRRGFGSEIFFFSNFFVSYPEAVIFPYRIQDSESNIN